MTALLLSFLLLSLSGCGEAPRTDEESVALIQQYFQAQQNGDIDAAVAMSPPSVREQMQGVLLQAIQDRGTVIRYVIESIEPNTVYSGKYYLANVRVTGRTLDGEESDSMEMVTALRKLSDDQTYIVAHKMGNH